MEDEKQDFIHLTERERDDIVRRELERRRKIADAHRGGTRSLKQRARISEGMRRSWARRKAITETARQKLIVRRLETPGGVQNVRATEEEMLALRAEGRTNAQIADALGVSRVLVHRKIGRQPARAALAALKKGRTA